MKFSIIITTTRPHLLKYSLRSAVAQTFDDYEVVVSDNSENGCRDMVESIGDSRVRYVRPDQQEALVAHWDFAFAQARGDWHLLLCDDDAITPNLLVILEKLIRNHPDVESICWKSRRIQRRCAAGHAVEGKPARCQRVFRPSDTV